MPLVVLALGAYVSGLLAGYSSSLIVVAAVATTAIIVGVQRDRWIAVALISLCLAGAVVARATERQRAECSAGLVRARTVRVVLDDSVAPGGYVGAETLPCHSAAWLAIEGGEAASGSEVIATGEVVRTQRGLLVQHARVATVRQPGILDRLRTSAGHGIDGTFGSDAPLVRALLIADRHQLSPEVRDRFAAAGLAHILAIAGLHVGIIALFIEITLELAGVPRRRANVVTIVVVVGYVAMIGAPVPAVRSATMLTALFSSRLGQRPTSRWAIVALGAAQPIVDPRVVLDAGYQLSVLGVLSMISAGMLGRRLGVHRLPWLAKEVAVTLLGTTVATIGSAAVVAWVFGRVSVAAPLTNLAATPLIAFAQPMIFCGMVFAPFHPIAMVFADAAHPLLAMLDGVATTAAGISWASVPVAPTAFAAAIAGIMSAATIIACASRDWQRPACVAVGAAGLLVWLPLAPSRSGQLEVHVIDVGQGDAIALRTPHAHWILIDAGRAWRGGDAGRATVIPYIGRRGGRLDLFVLSHPHTDHVGGAASVLHALRPSTFVDAGFPGSADAYRVSLDIARRDRVHWARAHPGDTLTIDGVSLRLLAPDSAWTASLVDPNLASVVVQVRYGEISMLFMGDAEEPEEDWLLERDSSALRADVLKVAHHGSRTSSSDQFLAAVQPRLALVSVGAGNSYGLPTPAVMHRLAARGAQVLRTDRLGTIVARTDGHRVFVDAAGDTWELPPRSSPRPAP
ncbi:MAG TPA: DNA internalization-related competence protein ComEC/Rec2 [Gemmatimonadaceae bacterium]|nr:DNA internalization-related competence protein ComEC/Rec2 [Gemmatimonadaceae bacterium]